MKKYTVEIPWSGYSRGYSIYEVIAESKDDAIDRAAYEEGVLVEREVIRDDTEIELEEAIVKEI